MAELVAIDRKRVNEAMAWISAKVSATLQRAAEDVGEYILDTFFGGDPGDDHRNAPRFDRAERDRFRMRAGLDLAA